MTSNATRLLRSIAHRRAGDPLELPIEGRLASFDGASGWLNTEPLTAEGLRGRVVLVDFWTYTCVNWLRTLPYLRAWHAKYAADGLTIVGVHTPEFGFEHDLENVTTQTRALGVEYPVAIDDGYAVWNDFANHYWPAVYIADTEGRLRHHHFGEGEYPQTEMVIQRLLVDAGASALDQSLVAVDPRGLEVAADWTSLGSPETYLGYDRGSNFAGVAAFDLPHDYELPADLALNTWSLAGNWTLAGHAVASNRPGARIAFRFHARDVNLVVGPRTPGAEVPFQVFLDGRPVGEDRGTDVSERGAGLVRAQTTLQLVRQRGPVADRLFEIEFLQAGAEAFCLTFG
jgi:thiol-disulfide isomerase/thioredoxin